MGNVAIAGTNYQVYGDLDAIDAYWNGKSGPEATKWQALVATNTQDDMNTRARALVTATEVLDAEAWIEAANTFALRDAIVNGDGKKVFEVAAFILAGMILLNPGVATQATSGSNVERIDAGDGTAVRFFAPTLGQTGRFPTLVQKWVGAYLAGASPVGVSGSYSTGTASYGPDATPNTPFDVDGDGYGTSQGD